jgi:hypothetical protein
MGNAATASVTKEEELVQPQTPPFQSKLQTMRSMTGLSLPWQVHVQNQHSLSMMRELHRVSQELQGVKDNNARLQEDLHFELGLLKRNLGVEMCDRSQSYTDVRHELLLLKEEVRLLKNDLQHEMNNNRRLQTQLEMQPQQLAGASWSVEGWC